ncbi:type I-E CRISPR-associated protein Cse2/CasB [Ralstonia solanacearum]|uniref:Putative CRISPR-associated protein Cse2 n=1 Tax=Ralstonia solanacearum (strain Po82) TaxID=1031711 RepID=F6FZ95_RALS8|nr:type I-E CRISPR-associated protein Cse2/CasB [Ralstonia solanacearum]AEG68386.1 putative CRISPR-associated protein Cse2 [Ralstonia solanacearum Po82]AMP69662.1 type I-E CRISPR-associated protein Cse2/CasB [Ralstonia solanacearum]AMP73430.1 type I-E CRISPR-associated protein Cse2/CasB [Ralstonia solanacearum]MBB6586849.1 type I-E CRISPR-associated protein Cse2/CasB [Ralstonia solanacearum]MCG3573420.1 type I-E CRISPR-associated protein Cse2/CasB [Ralstonia solanacearum]
MSLHKHYLDDAQRKWVRSWWQALQPREGTSTVPGALALLGRGDRAGLKRCGGMAELLTEGATFQLAERLLSLESAKERARFADDYDAVVLVAGVLSHVSQDRANGKSVIAGLGRSGRDATPKLSEIRFRRLLQGRDLDDFYRQLVRVVQLAERTADVAQLADDALAWCRERSHATVTPSHGVRFRWARDYYLASAESAE